ncbi:hypothetical protein ACIQ9Q_30920 [Streptomyces sp. NPDC094438]|uniref:hypothetical protein n=1 Tax=Streptomyces sp. NPDC094438 TaxID=3366061 RepID=UPI0038191A78
MKKLVALAVDALGATTASPGLAPHSLRAWAAWSPSADRLRIGRFGFCERGVQEFLDLGAVAVEEVVQGLLNVDDLLGGDARGCGRGVGTGGGSGDAGGDSGRG